MDRGHGAAGVRSTRRQPRASRRVLSQIRSSFPVLKNPANRHKAVGFTFEQWRYVFTNTFSEEEARRLYERYHIPASGRVFWGSALANVHPGPGDTHVDYKNPTRAPLLFISGGEDHLMPPSIQRSNAKHSRRTARSPRSSSTTAARTSCPRRPAGRRSPTTLCHGAGRHVGGATPSSEGVTEYGLPFGYSAGLATIVGRPRRGYPVAERSTTDYRRERLAASRQPSGGRRRGARCPSIEPRPT